MDDYQANGEWDLIGKHDVYNLYFVSFKNSPYYFSDAISFRKSVKYECCEEKYVFVIFSVHIQRRTLYFIFNLIFPCVAISLMATLGFALPPDSGEKIGLGNNIDVKIIIKLTYKFTLTEITTLLSIVMFLQLLTGIIPESSIAVPTIGNLRNKKF